MDLARELLAQAGYPDGFLIVEVVSEQDGELVDVAETMIGYLEEVGLQVKFLVQPPEEVPGTIEQLLGAEQAVLWFEWE
jgi:ABC-type transport system substrate-binding protein